MKARTAHALSQAGARLRRLRERRILAGFLVVFCTWHAYSAFGVYEVATLGAILFSVTLAVRVTYFTVISIWRDISSLIIWIYVDFSMIFWPAVAFWLGDGTVGPDNDGAILAFRLGQLCLIIHGVITLIAKKLAGAPRGNDGRIWRGLDRLSVAILWPAFVVFAFGATLLAGSLGLASLGGGQGVRLPFNLSGAINYSHLLVAPFVFIIFLDIFYWRGTFGRLKAWGGVYLLWQLVETAIRESKGQFVLGLVPVLLWSAYTGIFRYKVMRNFLLLVPVIFIMFPAISAYRTQDQAEQKSFVYLVVSSSQALFSDTRFLKSVGINIYERIFQTGRHIVKFEPYLDSPWTRGAAQTVIQAGGTPKFHTHVVDNISRDASHSSGASGLSDAFALGGAPLTLVTIALLSVASSVVVDSGRLPGYCWTPAGKAMAAFFILQLTMGLTWSWAFKSVLELFVWPTLFVFHGFWAGLAKRRLRRKGRGGPRFSRG